MAQVVDRFCLHERAVARSWRAARPTPPCQGPTIASISTSSRTAISCRNYGVGLRNPVFTHAIPPSMLRSGIVQEAQTSLLSMIFVGVRVDRGASGCKGVHLFAHLAVIDRPLDQQIDEVAREPVKRQPGGLTPKRKTHEGGHQDPKNPPLGGSYGRCGRNELRQNHASDDKEGQNGQRVRQGEVSEPKPVGLV